MKGKFYQKGQNMSPGEASVRYKPIAVLNFHDILLARWFSNSACMVSVISGVSECLRGFPCLIKVYFLSNYTTYIIVGVSGLHKMI